MENKKVSRLIRTHEWRLTYYGKLVDIIEKKIQASKQRPGGSLNLEIFHKGGTLVGVRGGSLLVGT